MFPKNSKKITPYETVMMVVGTIALALCYYKLDHPTPGTFMALPDGWLTNLLKEAAHATYLLFKLGVVLFWQGITASITNMLITLCILILVAAKILYERGYLSNWLYEKSDYAIRRDKSIETFKKHLENVRSQALSKLHEEAPPNATRQAQALYRALKKRGIKCYLEKWDGYKHIDIAIPWAHLNIEVNGNQHYVNSKQMSSDINRNYHSSRKGYKIIEVPNFILEDRFDEVADSIASTARGEYYKN